MVVPWWFGTLGMPYRLALNMFELRYFNMSRLAIFLLWLGAFAPFSP